MSQARELLQQICDDPTDLETRLVYADLLTEQGDARGVFIAQHCQLERMTGLEARYAELAASTERLEAAHAPAWLGDYLKLADRPGASGRAPLDALFNAEFRGGFLYRIAMTPEDIAAHWDWLREREPLQGIELRVSEYLPKEVHGLTQPRVFRTLKVTPDGWFAPNSVGDVLRWGLANLRELDLSGCDLGHTGAQLLSNIETDMAGIFDDWSHPPPLPADQLERLVLHGTKLSDEGARLLFSAETVRELRTLHLGQCMLTERQTLEALAASPLSQLRDLSIAGNNALGGQLDALAGWAVLGQLESLALPQSATPGDLQALYPEPSPALRTLLLSTAKGLLAEPARVAGAATQLTRLDIANTSVGDAGWAALLAEPSLKSLHTLRATRCSLSDKAISSLTASPLVGLLALDLSSNKLTDKGLSELASWPGLTHVTQLRVGNNRKLGAASFQALIDAAHFQPTLLDIGKLGGDALPSLRERFGEALRTS